MTLEDSSVNFEKIENDVKGTWFEFYCDKIYFKK